MRVIPAGISVTAPLAGCAGFANRGAMHANGAMQASRDSRRYDRSERGVDVRNRGRHAAGAIGPVVGAIAAEMAEASADGLALQVITQGGNVRCL